MDSSYATFLLNKNRDDYNRIATSFDGKRNYIPLDFKYLKQYIKENEKILDLGCGNGRFSELVSDSSYIGADISKGELKIAKDRYPYKSFILIENQLSFPFLDDSFDKVFCLSVLHHIPSLKFRQDFIKEIKRILKPGGTLILTVWNLKNAKKVNKLLFKYFFLKLIGKSKLGFKDIFYPWKDSNGNILAQRYIHTFSLKELRKLVNFSGLEILESKILDRSKKGSNILIVCKKCS